MRDQQDTIRAYAKSRGVALAHIYVEAESGIREKQERREQMIALLRDVRAGDLVLCDKLDRWSRDTEFTLRTVREIHEAGAAFYAVGDACDPSTSDGDVMLTMRAMMAKEEAKRIKIRMVGTRRLLRDAGLYSEGPPPFGYFRPLPLGVKSAEKNVLAVDPAKAAIVRRAFRMCAAGKPLAEIAAAVDLPKFTIYRILRQRIYLGGLLDSQGRWITGRHEALVDADTFARAAATMTARRLGGPRPHDGPSPTSAWFLRDVARCSCGAPMRSAYGHESKSGERAFYFRCSKRCGVPHIRVGLAESAAEPLIVARLEELGEALSRPAKSPAARKPADSGEKRAKLAARRERILEQHAEGLITTPALRLKLAAIDREVLTLDAADGAARRPSPLAEPKVRRHALRVATAARAAWSRATGEERRRIVGLIAAEVRLEAGKKPRPVWRPIEDLAAES